MCNVCAMTQSFVPERHEAGQEIFDGIAPQSGTFNETTDAAAGISTNYTMSAGDSFTGSISSGGDVDWVAITFQAGETYEIEALGYDSGGGTLQDTDLRLYDSSGTLIEYDDFDGAGWDAAITYEATTTGTYYIAVSSYFGGNTGSYTLDVGTSLPPYVPGTEASIAQLAEFLQGGSSGVERKFNTSVSNEITVNLSGLTAQGQQLARWAMEAWEMVADIDFVEVTIGEMITADDEDSGAFAYFPNSGSTAQGVELNVSTGWLASSGTRLDTYSFQTYIHEFGHAIGLNHQGAYNYTGSPITYENHADFANDSWQLSVMSYFSQTENTTTDASFAYVTTAQMADIVAIQDFYGAAGAGSITDGNTVYGQGSNVGNYLDEIFAQWATGATNANIGGNRVALTLYDAGGVDTLNLGYLGSNEAAKIDLNGGAFSNIGNEIDILGIAEGTVIEHLETGAGNDTITGNEAGNSIMSGAGNDSIDGGAGDDTITGGAGADTLIGGAGNDVLTGGAGNDVFVLSLGMGEDVIQDFEDGIDTLDTTSLSGGMSGITESSNAAGHLVLTLSDGSTVTLQDVQGPGSVPVEDPLEVAITGTAAEDDTLQANVSGPSGLSSAGPGDVAYQWLRDGVVIAAAIGAAYTLTQQDVGAVITVRATFDGETVISAGTLQVANVNDAPTGTVLIAGTSTENETLTVDTSNLADADGLGPFTYQWLRDGQAISGATAASYTLRQADVGAVISVLVSFTDAQGTTEQVLSETATAPVQSAPFLFGTDGDDVLGGDGRDDTISAGGGNDTVYGQDGDDSMLGGQGDDLLIGNEGNDTIEGGDGANDMRGREGDDFIIGGIDGDLAFGGDGNDTIDGLGGDDSLQGNGGNDSILGFDGNDRLFGQLGADTLLGESGEDELFGGDGDDEVFGGGDDDELFGGTGRDSLDGGTGNDLLRGNQQNDTLRGGLGEDTLFGDDGFDVLRGESDDDQLQGGNGNDTLDGGFGNDVLFGGFGNDELSGGLGQDTLRGNAGADTFVFGSVAESAFGAADIIDGIDGIGVFGGDRIDVSGIDANILTGADDAFTFLGATSTAAALGFGAGALWVENFGGQTRLFGLIDNDAVVDFEVRIKDDSLVATDYVVENFIL